METQPYGYEQGYSQRGQAEGILAAIHGEL